MQVPYVLDISKFVERLSYDYDYETIINVVVWYSYNYHCSENEWKLWFIHECCNTADLSYNNKPWAIICHMELK